MHGQNLFLISLVFSLAVFSQSDGISSLRYILKIIETESVDTSHGSNSNTLDTQSLPISALSVLTCFHTVVSSCVGVIWPRILIRLFLF